MKQGLLVFLVMCAFAIAMVPRDRRAVNTDEQEESSISKGQKLVCEPQTPCAWSVYKQNDFKIIDLNITNAYCNCSSDTACVATDEDASSSAMVYRCRKPGDRDEEAEGDS